jgi:hypothetical protein
MDEQESTRERARAGQQRSARLPAGSSTVAMGEKRGKSRLGKMPGRGTRHHRRALGHAGRARERGKAAMGDGGQAGVERAQRRDQEEVRELWPEGRSATCRGGRGGWRLKRQAGRGHGGRGGARAGAKLEENEQRWTLLRNNGGGRKAGWRLQKNVSTTRDGIYMCLFVSAFRSFWLPKAAADCQTLSFSVSFYKIRLSKNHLKST